MAAAEIRAELDKLGVRAVAPGLAEVAISLAESLDSIPVGDAPTARAVVARELHALMIRLRALAPVQEQGDSVDEFTREREARRAEVKKLHG
ncbi:hypothetical protein Q5762_13835 [Streptomyces sp. P9(2023)]|uniref:hypothetical protein n=1 Tax=Streptomyces sp. P9(2023) TaxID=3064394 RepID=UPI0028F458FE|nr:hypothetical protein [Streptomyces sp. P9(2023)]MDT9689397.1 hypothetical protein [Streptomyces sp. P9(2023)]